MISELVHTAAPWGLYTTASGYVTVGCTKGMPRDLIETLEEASPGEGSGPPVFRVWGVRGRLVITRIVRVMADYTGRPSRLTHHIVIDSHPQQAQDGRRFLMSDEHWLNSWDGLPRELSMRTSLPTERAVDSAVVGGEWIVRADHAARLGAHGTFALRTPCGVSVRQALAELVGASTDCAALSIATTPGGACGQRPRLVVVDSDADLPAGLIEPPMPPARVHAVSALKGVAVTPTRPKHKVHLPPPPKLSVCKRVQAEVPHSNEHAVPSWSDANDPKWLQRVVIILAITLAAVIALFVWVLV